ncbi:DNA sulfur modification protein DndD [Desulfofustis glycolicus]|uniref:DNA sulfur modification protein DndD n=1 Tax=Desulfofustis glycolicus DSM 9705 TaxID=1121409 RepID=A0A1M5UKF7_9BACT|nr:DNA sulfur modification protein DndD [Desulfofustis glycolicus]SHH63390.1 DNA sulfur modification protein DndD [Desulfofustis glycolicus DSM 9705]
MIFDEITIHNFGVYLGRNTVSLKPQNDQKPIILIGGFNGGGKTTFMDAFQLALFGKFSNCSNRGSLAYDKYLQKSIHKSVDPKDGAAVNLKFRHSVNGVERSYEVRRSWKLNRKNISETVEVLCDDRLDAVITEAWHEHAEQFLPQRISSLFFFDGEKIKDLAEFNKSTELISTGINQLLGLDLITQLMTDLVVLEKRNKLKLTEKGKRARIKTVEDNLRELSKKKEELNWQISESKKVLALIEKHIIEIDETFRIEGGELYQKREELELNKSTALKELSEIQNKLVELSGSELPLALISGQLRQILEQSEIEERASDNERLYDILRERDKAIKKELKSKGLSESAYMQIERLLSNDLKERASFREVDRYLHISADTRASIKDILNGSICKIASETLALLSRKGNIEEQIENLDRQLATVPDAEAIAQVIEQKEKTRLRKQEADISHGVLLKEIENIDKSIAAAEREIEKELEKEINSEYEHDSAARIIQHSKRSRKTLSLFREKVTRHHLERIERYVLGAFRQLLRKESLVTTLKLDPKTFEPEIMGADGRTVDAQRLSAGERQLLAVSLLWGLAQASGRLLPTIIDTPLGRLDTTHRTHLVKRYFPFASHQVMLLSTDEEINEKYYRMVKPWVSQEYHLEFDESKQSTIIRKGYFW